MYTRINSHNIARTKEIGQIDRSRIKIKFVIKSVSNMKNILPLLLLIESDSVVKMSNSIYSHTESNSILKMSNSQYTVQNVGRMVFIKSKAYPSMRKNDPPYTQMV